MMKLLGGKGKLLGIALACVIASASFLFALPMLSQEVAPQPHSSHQPLAVLPHGQLIESVPCQADPAETYALYLPSTYTPAKKWPIIYAFDPMARGSRPLELYKDIAEKYGFVIAGSNSSRNFSPTESAKGAQAMWGDTHLRLALDDRRIYMAGFSGGARFAGMLATNCARCNVTGVIANSASYPMNRKPGAKDNLLYFLAAGDEDFNWAEVTGARREREDSGEAYRMRVFPGSHQWSPAAVMEDAVEWMMLKAMQSGSQAADRAFIDGYFGEIQREADEAQKRGDAVAQLGAYRALASDFTGLRDISEFEKKLAVLKKSSALRTALVKERDQIVEQQRLQDEISPKLTSYVDGNSEDPVTLAREIQMSLGRLRDQSQHAKTEEGRHVAMRAFRGLWAQGIEAGQMALEARHFDKAVDYFQLISSVGDDAWPMLLLAETYAARGDKRLAMKSLREAVRRGLTDPSLLEKDTRLEGLHADDEFRQLLSQLKAKGETKTEH